MFYDIVDRTNAFVGHKNRNFKTSKHCDFLKRVSPWFSSKIGHFIIFFLLANLRKENVFHNIPERKNTFAGYKNEVQKVEKLGFFQRV